MFERLRAAISDLAAAVTERTLKEEEIDEVLSNFEIGLLESDVAHEVVRELTGMVRKKLLGVRVSRGTDSSRLMQTGLAEEIASVFSGIQVPDLLKIVREKNSRGEPFVIVFLGINGTGKTTSMAKVANMLKKNGLTVVMACGDTHRAGAIEQLTEHAQRLSLKTIVQRYGADPAAVARDAVLYARQHRVNVVLVDTAGRMQVNRNLMDEMAKIIRVVRPDFKIFVGDSLAGNDALSQAREFLRYTDFDAAILTKVDADVKGGSALSISYVTGKPVIYLGVGQSYDDLQEFNPALFVKAISP